MGRDGCGFDPESSAVARCFDSYRVRHNAVMKNLYREIPDDLTEELFETLVRTDAVHIERIVSRGHATPDDEWYDQPRNEWVLVLQGAARLRFEDGREIGLAPGDWLEIAAREKHRVAWTDPDQDTIWLAVHHL
jgi:cupin 2 domain-containing protein